MGKWTKLLLGIYLVLQFFISKKIEAQFAVAPNSNAVQLAQRLTGKGVSLSNITLACDGTASGSFNGGFPTIGMNTGVVLATGSVSNLTQPVGGFMSDFLLSPSDPDLDALVNNTNFDACVLEFDIRPLGDTIEFNFVFASEEYPEYVCSNFNDVFAFFLTGNKPGGGTYNNSNIALIPGTNLAVAINSVNPGVAGSAASGGNCNKPGESKNYSTFYQTNNSSNFVMDGMTVPILAKAAVIPCESYHLKFAIQDVGDGSYDSGVFLTTIKSNSVSVTSFTNVPLAQDTADIFEDPICNQGGFRFELDTSYNIPTTIKFDVLGSATNGVDYQFIADSVVVPAGSTFVNLPIIPIKDNFSEGKEKVGIYLKGTCTTDYIDSAAIYIYDEISANAGRDTNLCPNQTFQLNGSASTDFPWSQLFTYSWFPSQLVSNPAIFDPMFVPSAMNADTVQLYLRTQVMNCKADTDTVVIARTAKARFSIDAGLDDTICANQSTLINLSVVDSASESPFVFVWTLAASLNDSSIQKPTASPASTTQYNIEVRNKFGCPLRDSVKIVVAQPPQFTLTRSQDTVCPSFQVQLSFVLQNGSYDSIVWSPSNGANAVSNRTAINTQITPSTTQLYQLTAYNKGCAAQDSILIVVNDAMTVDAGNDTTVCLGNSAQLNAVVIGNKGAVTYVWQPSATLNISNIANPVSTPTTVTTYQVTASSVGCVKTDSVKVNTYSFTTQLITSDVSCFGGSDGSLSAIAGNGVTPYNYLWSNGAPDAALQSQLPAGGYSVTVNDVNGCTATASQIISQPSVLQFNNPVVNDVKCFGGSDGSISIQVIGGTPNYTYIWLPANANSNFIQGLSFGSYALTVSDSKGCLKDTAFVVSEPTELILDTASVNVSCFGRSNGRATIIASGGTLNYTYSWSNLSSQSSIQNVQTGNYTVTVFDANQCSKQANFVIAQPLQISLATSIIKNISCFGGNDGAATVQVNNGISPFSYLWSNNQITDTATNLNAATFDVTVTDNNGCTETSNVTLQQPTLLQSNPSVNNVTCFGGNNGSINSNPNGGSAPYAFAWSNNQATQNATQLSFGNYTATITDANGCAHTFSNNITQPDTLRATANAIRETCIALWDGKLIPNAFGGTPPYSFSYSRDQFSFTSIPFDTVQNLSPATYTVRVADANSCSADAQATLASPPKDEYDDIVEQPSCFGAAYQDGSIAVRGLESANAPFKYSLNNDGNFNSTGSFKKLSAGFYSIYIVNNNGCDTTIVVEVPEPQNAVLKVLPQDTTVNVGEKVLLDVTISPYPKSAITTYRWSPQQGLSCVDCANPVVTSYNDENYYEVIVTYNKGCIAKSAVTVFTDANPEIYTPNMFSPNGDGINDMFFVYGLGIRDFDLKIFNRWGEKVYESTEQTQGWDGFFRNSKQEPGAYVYYVQVVYLNNKKFSKTGSVTLMR